MFGLDEQLQPTLADMHDGCDDPAIVHGVRDTGGRVTLAIFDCTKPVIAAINGAAVGIGATMTLAMDIRLASDKARIGFVFGKIGIVPEACSIVVPAAHRRHAAGARVGVHGGHLRRGGGEARRPGKGRRIRPSSCSKRRGSSRDASSTTARPSRSALTRQMMYRNARPASSARGASRSTRSACSTRA